MKNVLKRAGKLLIEVHEDIKKKEQMRDLTSFEEKTKGEIETIMPEIRDHVADQDLLS